MPAVLLGVCEESISSKAVTTWKDNKVGGTPDWYQSALSNPKCSLCGRLSQFICQLYCPLANSPYHRTLYIFACCNKPCKNKKASWNALRFQSLPKQETCKSFLNDSDADFWGLDDVSWSDDNEDDITDRSENSAAAESPFNVCSISGEYSNLKDTPEQEVTEMPDQCVNGHTIGSEPGETTTEEQTGPSSDNETAIKLSQLSMTNLDDTEPVVADETETPVLIQEALLNMEGSILSKLLADSKSNVENMSSTTENDSTDTTFDSFYVNAYNEEDFTVDMKHCLSLQRTYLQRDSELRSFLHEWFK